MASTLEIKYFNSFWLKKMVSVVNTSSTGNGGNPSPNYFSNAVAPGNTTITVNGSTPNVFVGQVVSYTVGTAPSTTTYSHIVTNITFNGSVTTFTLSSPITITASSLTLFFTGNVSNSMSTQAIALSGQNTVQLRAIVNNIGIGQLISYKVGLDTYENTIKNISGGGITLTLKNKIPATIPIETLITFGVITDLSALPSMYTTNANDWAIEEARITGGYNNTSVDFGVKAYIVEDSLNRIALPSSIIFSGIYNSRTGINNTNEFSTGEDITKSVTPTEGSIQKLYSEDTNLIIFQESKVSRALIDKNAVYSAEGSPITTTGTQVIGQIQSYSGNYGIGTNPESFAVYGYRKYFTDATQNVVLRLSQDGITEISNYGMAAFFRESFSTPGVKQGFILGMFDNHSKQYVLSVQGDRSGNVQRDRSGNIQEYTLSFDEDTLGWVSFYSYKPDQGVSLDNDFYTFRYGNVYKHYSRTQGKAVFYDVPYKSTVTSIINPTVSMSKVFMTINYEGTPDWNLTSLYTESDYSAPISSYTVAPISLEAMQDQLFSNTFKKKENKFFANVLNITAAPTGGEVLYGASMSGIKGFFATVTFSTDNATIISTNTSLPELYAVSTEYVESSY
jgi:hypothetical protein